MKISSRGPRPTRRAAFAVLAVSLGVALAGCSGSGSSTTSVFRVKPGECFTAPKSVKAQLSSLKRVSCNKPHTQEAYAIVEYTARGRASASVSGVPSSLPSLQSNYPGEDVLNTFAQGACAQRYAGYVGVDYLDSSLYFTFLLPSARSWEQSDDRDVLCFITTTGQRLTKSVKGSRQ